MSPAISTESASLVEYSAEISQQTLIRLRWGALTVLSLLAIAVPVNLWTFTGSVGLRIASFTIEAAVCLLVLHLSRLAGVARHATALSVVFVYAVAGCVLLQLSLSPTDMDALVGPVASLILASAFLFPWGPRTQMFVTLPIIAEYLLLLPWMELTSMRAANVLISMAVAGTLSVVSALFLDRYRSQACVRTALVMRLSAVRQEEADIAAALCDVAQTASTDLDQPDLLQRVTAMAVSAIGCDWGLLYVWDARAGLVRMQAQSGLSPSVAAELASLDFPWDALPVIDATRPGQLLEIADIHAQTLVPPDLLTHWEIASELLAPMGRGEQLVGALCVGYRERTGPFSTKERRLAIGIAHTVAVALQNVRLIKDLQEASRLKSEFLSTMSHELRTPLNVILGFAEMGQDPDCPAPERERSWTRVDVAARDLLILVESTLQLGKIEAGRDDVELVRESLVALWADIRRGCEGMPCNPEVTLVWTTEVPDVVLLTDVRKLTLVLRNLVHNALKFTARGSVRVDCTVNDGDVTFRVADTGIGIRTEDRETVFEMFRQADGSDSRSHGGTGLGLYIVRRFIAQLGGAITLETTPGKGSIFTATIPGAVETDRRQVA